MRSSNEQGGRRMMGDGIGSVASVWLLSGFVAPRK